VNCFDAPETYSVWFEAVCDIGVFSLSKILEEERMPSWSALNKTGISGISVFTRSFES
jgi:hypothetical protein